MDWTALFHWQYWLSGGGILTALCGVGKAVHWLYSKLNSIEASGVRTEGALQLVGNRLKNVEADCTELRDRLHIHADHCDRERSELRVQGARLEERIKVAPQGT